MKVTLYSRPNCQLCIEAVETLKLVQEDINFTIEHVNIEQNDELHERFALMVPVVMHEGQIIQYGLVDYATILEALSQ